MNKVQAMVIRNLFKILILASLLSFVSSAHALKFENCDELFTQFEFHGYDSHLLSFRKPQFLVDLKDALLPDGPAVLSERLKQNIGTIVRPSEVKSLRSNVRYRKLYHGTTLERAQSIMKYGPMGSPSAYASGGSILNGFFTIPSQPMASEFAQLMDRRNGSNEGGPVVLEIQMKATAKYADLEATEAYLSDLIENDRKSEFIGYFKDVLDPKIFRKYPLYEHGDTEWTSVQVLGEILGVDIIVHRARYGAQIRPEPVLLRAENIKSIRVLEIE